MVSDLASHGKHSDGQSEGDGEFFHTRTLLRHSFSIFSRYLDTGI